MNSEVYLITGPNLPAPIRVLDTASSVLDAAREPGLLPPPWGSVLARTQTAGRGQLRRRWHSPPGNVYAALRLPQEPPFSGTTAPVALGGLLAAALEGAAGKARLDVRLKWPNDLVVLRGGSPYKVGGILLEERDGCLLAGVGVNWAWAPPEQMLRRENAMPAARLADMLPEEAPYADGGEGLTAAEALWRRLVSGVYFWYAQKFFGKDAWRHLAEKRLLWKGRMATLSENGKDVRGELRGIGPAGGVLLAAHGRVEEFLSGSLSGAVERAGVSEGQ